MGNRAVITFAPKSKVEPYYKKDGSLVVGGFVKDNPNLVGVYVHWNGGNDSIIPFCRACKEIGFRCPTYDFSYGVARFVQLVANFFGGCNDCSVGVNTLDRLDTDNYDNGVYIIGEDWEIVGREFGGYADSKLDEKDVEAFVKYLVDTQKGIDVLKKKLNEEEK